MKDIKVCERCDTTSEEEPELEFSYSSSDNLYCEECWACYFGVDPADENEDE